MGRSMGLQRTHSREIPEMDDLVIPEMDDHAEPKMMGSRMGPEATNSSLIVEILNYLRTRGAGAVVVVVGVEVNRVVEAGEVIKKQEQVREGTV